MLAGIFVTVWSWLLAHLFEPIVAVGPRLLLAAAIGFLVYAVARVVLTLTAGSKGNR